MNKCCQEKEDVAPEDLEDLGCVQCGDEFTNQPDLMEHMELCKEGPGKASFIRQALNFIPIDCSQNLVIPKFTLILSKA